VSHVAATWQGSSTQLARFGIPTCLPMALNFVPSVLVMYDKLFLLCTINPLCPGVNGTLYFLAAILKL
jgi:hypothetical protein